MSKEISDLEKEVGVEKKEWPILRISWVLMGLFVIAGGLGLFGNGLLSQKVQGNEKLRIEYDRLLRYSLASEIVITAGKLNPDSSLLINADYARKVKIEKISPEPQEVKMENGKIRMKFSSAEGRGIVFYVHPISRGGQRLIVEANNQKVNINQYIFF